MASAGLPHSSAPTLSPRLSRPTRGGRAGKRAWTRRIAPLLSMKSCVSARRMPSCGASSPTSERCSSPLRNASPRSSRNHPPPPSRRPATRRFRTKRPTPSTRSRSRRSQRRAAATSGASAHRFLQEASRGVIHSEHDGVDGKCAREHESVVSPYGWAHFVREVRGEGRLPGKGASVRSAAMERASDELFAGWHRGDLPACRRARDSRLQKCAWWMPRASQKIDNLRKRLIKEAQSDFRFIETPGNLKDRRSAVRLSQGHPPSRRPRDHAASASMLPRITESPLVPFSSLFLFPSSPLPLFPSSPLPLFPSSPLPLFPSSSPSLLRFLTRPAQASSPPR